MYILGISCYYHDASATLLKDGRIVAAAAEERFTRKKHDKSYPKNAIRFCLEKENIEPEDLDHIAFYEKPFLKFERILHQHISRFPSSYTSFLKTLPSWITKKLRIKKTINNDLQTDHDIAFIKHHKCHAASAYYPSPYNDAAILTVDGVGEWTTTAYGTGVDGEITMLGEQRFPDSLGLLYSTITSLLGFRVNNSEYKVMGLAAHGTMNREDNQYYDKLSQTITQHDDASFTLDMEYYSFHTLQKMYTSKLKSLLDDPPQKTDRPTKHQQDIAAALQLLTEDLLLDLMQHVYQETGRDRLVYAGGVALNSAFNGKILDKTPFNDVWIQPAASDCGGSLGAATYLNHQVSDNEVEEMKTVSLGPAYHDKDIQEYLNTQNIQYKHYTDQTQLINEVAEKISENRVVAVCRGRMEWGPRALGNRSILANPCDPEAKTRLNEHIKHREQFRPFAPSVQAEHANKYFDVPDNQHLTDYMLAVHDVKPEWQEDLPSITHVNGTGRLQTVKSSRQPWFHQLLTAVNQTIGVPIVINTSFNLSGEPIVENPKDALQTLQNSKIDHLLIENNLINRQDL